MTGDCAVEGCLEAPTKRHLCPRHYTSDLRARHKAGEWVRPRHVLSNTPGETGSDQETKVAYLGSLTLGELNAYCTGVLSRASICGDPDEVEEWRLLLTNLGTALVMDEGRRPASV